MSLKLQIGNTVYNFPVQGDPNWGEDVTAWAEGVTDALANFLGPNDILATSSTLNNSQSTPLDIPGLTFDTADVLSVEIAYFIKREGTTTETESGLVRANFDGSTWKSTQESEGDVGVIFSITAGGQVQYTSSDFAGHTASTVRYTARTIDEP